MDITTKLNVMLLIVWKKIIYGYCINMNNIYIRVKQNNPEISMMILKFKLSNLF